MIMEQYGLETKIGGKSIPDFLAQLIEKNENQQVEIERGKLTISAIKQLNNYSRLALDAEKFQFKRLEKAIADNHNK